MLPSAVQKMRSVSARTRPVCQARGSGHSRRALAMTPKVRTHKTLSTFVMMSALEGAQVPTKVLKLSPVFNEGAQKKSSSCRLSIFPPLRNDTPHFPALISFLLGNLVTEMAQPDFLTIGSTHSCQKA